jgi:3-hydroxymyristoyl/3-hydroxydecanoyl-(acyl carrier protein) dehydratase
MGAEEILRILPHRYPFLLVDRGVGMGQHAGASAQERHPQ